MVDERNEVGKQQQLKLPSTLVQNQLGISMKPALSKKTNSIKANKPGNKNARGTEYKGTKESMKSSTNTRALIDNKAAELGELDRKEMVTMDIKATVVLDNEQTVELYNKEMVEFDKKEMVELNEKETIQLDKKEIAKLESCDKDITSELGNMGRDSKNGDPTIAIKENTHNELGEHFQVRSESVLDDTNNESNVDGLAKPNLSISNIRFNTIEESTKSMDPVSGHRAKEDIDTSHESGSAKQGNDTQIIEKNNFIKVQSTPIRIDHKERMGSLTKASPLISTLGFRHSFDSAAKGEHMDHAKLNDSNMQLTADKTKAPHPQLRSINEMSPAMNGMMASDRENGNKTKFESQAQNLTQSILNTATETSINRNDHKTEKASIKSDRSKPKKRKKKKYIFEIEPTKSIADLQWNQKNDNNILNSTERGNSHVLVVEPTVCKKADISCFDEIENQYHGPIIMEKFGNLSIVGNTAKNLTEDYPSENKTYFELVPNIQSSPDFSALVKAEHVESGQIAYEKQTTNTRSVNFRAFDETNAESEQTLVDEITFDPNLQATSKLAVSTHKIDLNDTPNNDVETKNPIPSLAEKTPQEMNTKPISTIQERICNFTRPKDSNPVSKPRKEEIIQKECQRSDSQVFVRLPDTPPKGDLNGTKITRDSLYYGESDKCVYEIESHPKRQADVSALRPLVESTEPSRIVFENNPTPNIKINPIQEFVHVFEINPQPTNAFASCSFQRHISSEYETDTDTDTETGTEREN